MPLFRDLTMQLSYVEFDYKPGTDYGTGTLFITNKHKYHYFDFEFTAIQDRDCSYSCHSFSQELPDEDYYEHDVIDEILNLDSLVHMIETIFNQDNLRAEIEDFIREEFYKISKERYLYTRKG